MTTAFLPCRFLQRQLCAQAHLPLLKCFECEINSDTLGIGLLMTDEDRQRTIDFILNTLAEVTTKISTLTDAQARTDATVATLTGQVQHIARQQEHINNVVVVIAEAQQHTDERLNALIDIVQGRNGES